MRSRTGVGSSEHGVACVAAAALVAAISGLGCNLISGLSELSAGGSTSSGGTGGGGATGGTTTSGGGGATGGSTGGTGGTTTSGDTCGNGVKDGAAGETDVDCGGPCEACQLGRGCAMNTDCESQICRVDGASGNPDKQCVGVQMISTGSGHTCAVLSTRELFCWGANAHGQLGNGNNLDSPSPVKINVANVSAVATGGRPDDKGLAHTCAMDADGGVFCWGANGSGQLGTGDQQDVNLPLLMPVLKKAKRVTAGAEVTCAIQMDDTVACWGANTFNQLANGTGVLSKAPLTLSPAISATAISAGVRHVCAVLPDASLKCWGNNERGETGSATLVPSGPVNAVPIVMGATVVRAGADFSCAIDAAGLACWGDNSDAELTDAVAGAMTSDPTALDVTGALDVAAGSDGDGEPNDPNGGHACAVIAGGKVVCWGNNRHGQLGRGGAVSDVEPAPAEVMGLTGAVAITAGAEVTCARFETGQAKCWGRNDQGQLGTGQMTETESSPVPIAWP